jgi:hypothetical protein
VRTQIAECTTEIARFHQRPASDQGTSPTRFTPDTPPRQAGS